MSERGVDPLDSATGAEATAPLGRGQRAAWAAGHRARTVERVLPGVTQFDSQELSGGAGLRQAYAQFTVDPRNGATSIRIHDAGTHAVIREIPPAQVLEIASELQQYLAARQQGGERTHGQ